MADVQTELRKFVAPEFVFGVGARHIAARYAQNLGASKVLIVTDPGIIAAGWTKEVSKTVVPDGSLIDPLTLTTVPRDQTTNRQTRAGRHKRI